MGNDLVDIIELFNSIYDREDGGFVARALDGIADTRLIAYYARRGPNKKA